VIGVIVFSQANAEILTRAQHLLIISTVPFVGHSVDSAHQLRLADRAAIGRHYSHHRRIPGWKIC